MRKPGPEAGQPDGLELVLTSVPLQGAVAIAAGHSAKWRGKGTLSKYAHPPWAHTHLAKATPEGSCPGGSPAENSHTGLFAASPTSWQPWEPLPPRPSSSTPAILKVPCPSLMGGAAQSTREQASGITPLILVKVPGENVRPGETQRRPQSSPSPA